MQLSRNSAGFDVSSNIAGYTPNCPECSQCKGDGTDEKCNQHANWNLCEMDPGCVYNNMTKQCNSLPEMTIYQKLNLHNLEAVTTEPLTAELQSTARLPVSL